MTLKINLKDSNNSCEEYDLYKYFSKKELKVAAKELKYMKKHLDEYSKYDNWEDLKKDLLLDNSNY